MRVFFPKGSLAKCHSERNDLPDIDERYCQEVVRICENALVKIYGQREPMGKVYLSDDYRNYVVPFSQRSASKALKRLETPYGFADKCCEGIYMVDEYGQM